MQTTMKETFESIAAEIINNTPCSFARVDTNAKGQIVVSINIGRGTKKAWRECWDLSNQVRGMAYRLGFLASKKIRMAWGYHGVWSQYAAEVTATITIAESVENSEAA